MMKKKMIMPPYEYFAIHYVNQWLNQERELYHSLKENTFNENELRSVLSFFKISRNFKGISYGDKNELTQEKEKAVKEKINLISNAVITNSNDLTVQNYIDKVVELQKEFKKSFDSNLISASSKLLWMRKRTPIIVYDQYASKGLIKLNTGLNKVHTYKDYCNHWRKEYKKHKSNIIKASNDLLNDDIKPFCALWCVSSEDAKQIVNSEWFYERVFDMYLMHRGKL